MESSLVVWGSAGLLLVAGLAAFSLSRRRLAAQSRQLAAYVSSLPNPSGQAPEVNRTLEPILAAARHMSGEVSQRLSGLTESWHQLEVLLEGMQDAVLSVDAAGRVQWSNAHMQRLIFRDAAGASMRHGRALVHTFRDPALLAFVQTTLDERIPAQCQSEAVLPGRTFQVNASPLPGGGAVVVLHDRTDAEQMERAQRDFVANVSHELRTPLTSIVGYVETVLDHEQLSPAAAEFLETVLKNASRMQRLTEDLLVLSQVEQPENMLSLQPVPVESLLQDALRTVTGAAYAEGANLDIEASTGVLVLADANAVQQVLGNLLENAVKYSGGRSEAPNVKLGARVEEDDPLMVRFWVRDSGPGIASDHLPRIFERFYRVEKARSRAVGGTGLGLSIARSLVEQHGGRMWAESNLGQGSTFFFTLRQAD